MGRGERMFQVSDSPFAAVGACALLALLATPACSRRVTAGSIPAATAPKASLGERYGAEVSADWAPDTLPWDRWPIDVGFLNDGDRPAGRHGRVAARGDRLVFEDGTVARFWGTNVVAHALFHGERAQIARQAKRLAALGYN